MSQPNGRETGSGNQRPLIIGAGPGGIATALFLAKAGIASHVIDKATFPRDKVCGDAFSGKVVEVLNQYEPAFAQQFVKEQEHLVCHGVSFVSPKAKWLDVPFSERSVASEPSTGFIATREVFDAAWVEEAKRHPLIEVTEGVGVKTIQRAGANWAVSLSTNDVLRAPAVVGAAGVNGPVARQVADWKPQPKHYCAGLRQYHRNVTGLKEGNFIELHFLKRLLPGYFWIFPLPNGQVNVGLGMRSDVVARKRVNLKRLLEEIIREDPTIAPRFKHAEALEPIRGCGLPMGSKKWPISGEGYLLVGDEGSLIDPFSGEGIGNAMIAGRLAAETLQAALATGDLSAGALQAYDKAVWKRLGPELRLSTLMQRLATASPGLLNLVVSKANRNATLRETISCMFEDLDLRNRLRNPLFYLRILVN